LLSLQVYVPQAVLTDVLALLRQQSGVDHIVRVGPTAPGDLDLITSDIDAQAVDVLLPLLVAAGVSGEEISIQHIHGSRPLGAGRRGDLPSWGGGALAWLELATSSQRYAKAAPQYLVYMVCAGVIAVFGVLTRNTILIIGAMAVSPDLLPLCATCVGLVSRRRRLAGRAFGALIMGLTAAGVTAFLVTTVLRRAGWGPATKALGGGGLGVLPTVNIATIGVALVAGIAGILAFETTSGAAVGVAISITTIPAAAFAGAEAAVRDWAGAGDALGVLAANITVLVLAGTTTLVIQRRRSRATLR
jgi:uncharacterized hydrophobic protein (TIGR00271 family)